MQTIMKRLADNCHLFKVLWLNIYRRLTESAKFLAGFEGD